MQLEAIKQRTTVDLVVNQIVRLSCVNKSLKPLM